MFRIFILFCGGALLGGAAILFAAHWWIQRSSSRYVIGQMAALPPNRVGLVLGTSAYSAGHRRNPHFENRMAAAAHLFQAGFVRHLLLSGNKNGSGYDEPAQMQRSLIAKGVPGASLTQDGAGFRTLDSVVRARKVFGLRKITLITDRFHCYRAVFLARHFGLDAVAFPSQEVRHAQKSRMREWLADVRACLDVYVLHTQPKELGVPVARSGL